MIVIFPKKETQYLRGLVTTEITWRGLSDILIDHLGTRYISRGPQLLQVVHNVFVTNVISLGPLYLLCSRYPRGPWYFMSPEVFTKDSLHFRDPWHSLNPPLYQSDVTVMYTFSVTIKIHVSCFVRFLPEATNMLTCKSHYIASATLCRVCTAQQFDPKAKLKRISSVVGTPDRLCGLVIRVPGYRSRGSGFDSRRYQIFWEVVGLERGPLRLVRIIEELLEWKSSGSGQENRINGRGIRCVDHATLSIHKSWH
jgi:hypothetical protein